MSGNKGKQSDIQRTSGRARRRPTAEERTVEIQTATENTVQLGEEEPKEKVTRTRRRTSRRTQEAVIEEQKSIIFKAEGKQESISHSKFVINSLPSEDDEDDVQEAQSPFSFPESAPELIPEPEPEPMPTFAIQEEPIPEPAPAFTIQEKSISDPIPAFIQKESQNFMEEFEPVSSSETATQPIQQQAPYGSIVFRDDNNNVKLELDSTSGGMVEGDRKSSSVFNRLSNAISDYNDKNTGIFSDDVSVRYEDDNSIAVKITSDGRMCLPNRRLFKEGHVVPWDFVNEIRIQKGMEVELDLGVSFLLPNHYALEIFGISDMRNKYGVELVNGVQRLNRQTAMQPITLVLRALDDLAYVQHYQSIVQARLVQV